MPCWLKYLGHALEVLVPIGISWLALRASHWVFVSQVLAKYADQVNKELNAASKDYVERIPSTGWGYTNILTALTTARLFNDEQTWVLVSKRTTAKYFWRLVHPVVRIEVATGEKYKALVRDEILPDHAAPHMDGAHLQLIDARKWLERINP